MTRNTPVEQIRLIDAQLLLAGERLAKYRDNGQHVSALVQRGVIDRLLGDRLAAMGARGPPPPRTAARTWGAGRLRPQTIHLNQRRNTMTATIKDVADFFKTGDAERDSLKAFSVEWKALDDESKEQFKTGIGDGSFTY